MKNLFLLVTALILISACSQSETTVPNSVNWGERMVDPSSLENLESGSTYLSVYPQIYSQDEHRTHFLTVTVSLKNVSPTDSVFVSSARYFDTHGTMIRSYFDAPIYISPMETVEIVLKETSKEGGTGANFLFEWMVAPGTHEPLFESVMISTAGQQGLSFTTQGVRVD